jgi:hypothetical protein
MIDKKITDRKSLSIPFSEQIRLTAPFITVKSKSRRFFCLLGSKDRLAVNKLAAKLAEYPELKINGPLNEESDWVVGVETQITFAETIGILDILKKESTRLSCHLHLWMIELDKKPQ